jgi:hypothetical protein
MNSLPPTLVEKGSDDQPSLFNRQQRSKRRDILTVLGKVRVSKFTPKCQNIQTRTPKATISKPISVNSAVIISNSTQQQMSKRREIKPRRVIEKALANFFHRGWPRQMSSLKLGPNGDQRQNAAATSRFKIEQGLKAGRPLSGHVLRLGPSRPEVNGYQGSQ